MYNMRYLRHATSDQPDSPLTFSDDAVQDYVDDVTGNELSAELDGSIACGDFRWWGDLVDPFADLLSRAFVNIGLLDEPCDVFFETALAHIAGASADLTIKNVANLFGLECETLSTAVYENDETYPDANIKPGWIGDAIKRQNPTLRELRDSLSAISASGRELPSLPTPEAHRILSRLGQSLRDGGEPSLYAKMDTGETIADAIEAYLKKVEAE